jgi:peptidoglycan/xylan/chitin deacetylase (PgdA/CDA1 family)
LIIIWGLQMGIGDEPPQEAYPRLTRRVLLVAGGLTLLAGCSSAPAGPAAAPPPPIAGRTRADAAPAKTAGTRTPGRGPARTRLARAERTRTRPGERHEAGDLPVAELHDGPKAIALTIDDGPSPVYTPEVLRLLARHRVTATFSMVGIHVAAHPGLAREVAAAGHQIANHTWSHLDLAWLPPAAVTDQMDRATGAIHHVTGRVPRLFRAPYGAWSPDVLRHCAQTGMTPLAWSVDPRDWARPGVAPIVRNIMRNTRAGSIILEHDGGGNRSQTVAALKVVLPRLLAAGYRFTTP